MGMRRSSRASLRLFGDSLVPDEITALLGSAPTSSQRKGQEFVAARSGNRRIAKSGSWQLSAVDREPGDLATQVAEILGLLTPDVAVWVELSRRFEMDLFCGLFMASRNDGEVLSAAMLLALGQRGISIGLDIYRPVDDESDDSPRNMARAG